MNKKESLLLVLGLIAMSLTICFGKYVISWEYFPKFFSGSASDKIIYELFFEVLMFETFMFSALAFFGKALEKMGFLEVDLDESVFPIALQIVISVIIAFILYLDGLSFMLSFIMILPIILFFWIVTRIVASE